MKKDLINRRLEDDYEASQLNPKYVSNTSDVGKEVTKLIGHLPEKVALEMRVATFDTIMEDVIEQVIEEKTEEYNNTEGTVNTTPSESEIKEKVEPIVEQAIALHKVPSSIRSHLSYLIAKQLKRHDPYITLLSKVAHNVTNAMVTMEESNTVVAHIEEDCPVVDDALDTKTADTGVNIADPSTPAEPDGYTETSDGVDGVSDIHTNTLEGELPKSEEPKIDPVIDEPEIKDKGVNIETEKVEYSGDSAQVEREVPNTIQESMKYLAVSAVNHRKATAILSHRLTGVMLHDMLYSLRNQLPEKYKAKYNLKF